MLGKDEVPGSDASAKTLTRSGVLTPASDNSLNLSDGVSSRSKKRKRDGNTMEDLLKESFAVKVSTLKIHLSALAHNIAAIPFYQLRQASKSSTTHPFTSSRSTTSIFRLNVFFKSSAPIATIRSPRQNT